MKRAFRKWLELMRAQRDPYPKLALGLADLQVAFEAGWEARTGTLQASFQAGWDARDQAQATETTKTIA